MTPGIHLVHKPAGATSFSLVQAFMEEVRAAAEAELPMKRYGTPEEFGRVAAFLLSPAAAYVSGSTVQVDGAMITALP